MRKRSIGGDYQFFYPRIGTSITVDEMRTGKELPLELVAADIIPAVLTKGGAKELIVYANESFDAVSYKNLMAYGLSFASGLITNIKLGCQTTTQHAMRTLLGRRDLHFIAAQKRSLPFSFNRSILDLLQETPQ